MKKRAGIFLTIKREMFLLSVASFLAVSLLISGIFLKILYENSLRDAREALRECNRQILTFTEGLFRENTAIIELLSKNELLINRGFGDEEELLGVFDEVLYENENLTYAYAGYADGSLHIRQYTAPAGYDVTTRPWYQAAVASTGVTQLVYSDAATGAWLFSQCMKLVDEEGVVVGAIALDCSNESITKQLRTRYRYQTQRSYIITSDGTVLLHPREQYINRSLKDYIDEEGWQRLLEGGSYGEYVLDGVKTNAYLERIPGTEFYVATSIDATEIMDPIVRSIALLLTAMVSGSLLVGVALSRVFINRFARPIQELSGRIGNLAAGNPDQGRELGTSNAEIQSIAENIEIIVKDIATREESRKAAEYLSFHDSMTGLYNRRYFEEELNRLDTKRNYPLCVVCCDVNGLKLVNDVFGHALGDRLLIAVADCMQQAMRTDDVVARMGGDEFSILLPQTSAKDAKQVIRRLKAKLPVEGLCGAEVSVSMGFALKDSAEQRLDEVLRLADEMMYERKIVESGEMKRRTVENIITAAKREGLVGPLNEREQALLKFFSDALCPESETLLAESYQLRRLGLCTLLRSLGYNQTVLSRRHTETGYQILSALDEYRGVAACVLHYKEHWDGSGWPSGLSGLDIPLLSRIIAVVEAYVEEGSERLWQKSGIWYDKNLVAMLGGKQF